MLDRVSVRLRPLICVLTICAACAAAATGCASGSSEDATTGAADLTLNPGQCGSPMLESAPHLDASGAPVAGTSRTTLNGCFLVPDLADANGQPLVPDGAALLGRVTSLLADASKLTGFRDANGNPVFRTLTASNPVGTVSTGQSQDVAVKMGWTDAPTGQIRVTLRQPNPQTLTMSLITTTALQVPASGALPASTDVAPGAFSINVRFQAASNGVSMVGTADIALLADQSLAGERSQLVKQLFDFVKGAVQGS